MAKKTLAGVLVAGLLLAAVPAAAAPLQKSEIGPAANWVVHANLEAFRNSRLGRLIVDELVTESTEQKLQSFATIFSFNPLQDIRDVTLYGKGQDRSNAVAIIDGRFDRDRLLAAVRLNAQYEEITYNGLTLYRWLHEEEKAGQKTSQLMYGCFFGQTQVVISAGLDALKRAADTLKGTGTGTATALVDRIPEIQGAAFLQAAGINVADMAGKEPKAAVLQQTDMLGLAAGASGDKVFAELRLVGRSAEVAENMAKLLMGIVALAQLSGNEQPRLAELARSVTVSRVDSTTQVRFEAGVQPVFQFLKEQWDQKRQQQSQQPPGTPSPP